MASVEKKAEDLHISGLLDCPKCGHSNPEGTRHCDNCGASLAGVQLTAPKPTVKKEGFFTRLFSKHK